MKQDYSSNIIIIGAGVAGMTAALYLKRAGFDSVIIEREIPGGQINKAFSVENYPGFMKVNGKDLSNSIFEQIKKLEIEYVKDEVVAIKCGKGKRSVILKNGNELAGSAIIIAVGRHPKRLDIPKLSSFVGKGLSYCATCDGRFFKGKDVLVIGGSNSALEEAVYLANICNMVTIVHRRDEFRAEKAWQDAVKATKNIHVEYNAQLKELINKDDVLSEAILKYKNGGEKHIKIDGCFSSIGYEPSTDIFDGIVAIDDEGYIKTDSNGKTSKVGIYAIGDVVKKEVFQLLTAMNDAVVVSSAIAKYVKEKK